MVHIASEIVVLVGISFYFSSKNKKLLGHIEELAQRIEEQEDTIQKLETTLQQINGRFGQIEMAIAHLQMANQSLHEKVDSGERNSPPVRVQPQPQPVIKNGTKKAKKITQQTPLSSAATGSSLKFSNKPVHFTPVVEEVKETPSPPKVQFNTKTLQESEPDPESDSDLDEEIRAELDELSEKETDFKKDVAKVK